MIYIAAACRRARTGSRPPSRSLFTPDARQHHAREHGRPDGGEVVPVHRRAVPVHLVLEPDRLHPAADQHRARSSTSSASQIPAFAIYAATANVSVPLVLALVVFVSYNVEGIRAKGSIGYLKSLDPGGRHRRRWRSSSSCSSSLSNFMRLISLSVRLFANILAGHLIILFMSGGLAVLLGIEALGWFTLPVRDRRCSSSRSAWSRRCRRSSSPP